MSTSTSFPQFQLRSSSEVSRMLRAGARSMSLGLRRRLQVDAVLTDRQPEVQQVAQQLFNSMHATFTSRASDFLRSVACRVNMNLNAYPTISTMLADAGAAIARACEMPQLPAAFPMPGSTATAPAMQISPDVDDSSTGAPLLQHFLDRADRIEVLYACLLSDLSNMAYEVSRLEDEQELMRHSLTLVSSSDWPLYGPIRQDEGAAAAADKTSSAAQAGAANQGKRAAQRSSSAPGHSGTRTSGVSRSQVAALQPNARSSGGGAGVQAAATSPPRSSAVAASTHRNSRRAALPTNPSSSRVHTLGDTSVNHALPAAAAAATCLDSVDSAVTPVDAAPVAAAAADKGAAQAAEPAQLTAPPPPAAWFSADDAATKTRFLVIQGSTSLGHWAINFNIEPVPFEDPALGVRVHRGVYEAAIQLYEELLPLVRQHLASSPDARVALGGHSLGGSVAAVIMLLLVSRAGVAPERLAPCYAFGAPAVFCAGGAGGCAHSGRAGSSSGSSSGQCDACMAAASPAALAAAPATAGAACGSRRSLMARLGIPETMLTNVVMHKDIVPRAFLCNYAVVADFLKSFVPSFKDHSTLSAGHDHKYLYTYLGTVAVLRPDDDAPFVLNDNAHPMLPNEAGLYKLRDPQNSPAPSCDSAQLPSSTQNQQPQSTTPTAIAPSSPAAATPQPAAAVLPTLRAALLAFMDHPHPLQYLSSLSSYGTEGAISRYHNPANYTRGLARLLEPLTSQWTHLTH